MEKGGVGGSRGEKLKEAGERGRGEGSRGSGRGQFSLSDYVMQDFPFHGL